MRVLYQTADYDYPANSHILNALIGFETLGYDSIGFKFSELKAGLIDLQPDDLLLGGVEAVYLAFAQMGISKPAPVDYPPELAWALRRNIVQSTIKHVHSLTMVNDKLLDPVFIKPVEHKLFRGHVVSEYKDRILTSGYLLQAPETPIWVSEVREFVCEYRLFFHHGKCVSACHYYGDASRMRISRSFITHVEETYGDKLTAYCLDVGVDEFSDLHLVEVNDALAFGAYGLPPKLHAQMILDRWNQLKENPC